MTVVREQVRRQVLDTAVAMLEVDRGALRDDTEFAGLGVDSLALVEFALSLEDVFDVEIPEEEVAVLTTIGDLVDALVEKASAGLDA